MTDIELWLLGITTACLCVEVLNTGSLFYIIRWIGHAGESIVGKISQSVGLQRGKGGSILSQIKDTIEKVAPAANGSEEPIDLGEFGSYTPSQIKSFAQQFGGKVKAGTASLPQGASMGALEGLMKGQMPKNIWEALPLLMQVLNQPAQPNGGSRSLPSNATNSSWD